MHAISEDSHGALMPGPRCERSPTGTGRLDGLRFAVKDLIDVGGAQTTGGNPDWAATHAAAPRDAPAVAWLRAAGAAVYGKAVTDELAFSLEGENAHFGTPRNPKAPHYMPGGSSSGSAVAVASGLVDFALGTDTGGSVRIPASFCGLFGMRPTHGRVPLTGVIPFAPSYDTVGWLARDARTLQEVGHVLLTASGPCKAISPLHLHVADDAFDLIDPACAAVLRPIADHLASAHAQKETPHPRDAPLSPAFDGATRDWTTAYQVLQGAEIWHNLGHWLTQHRPRFGANIAPRFASLPQIRDEDVRRWSTWRARQTQRLLAALAPGHVWLIPTAPTPPLPLTASGVERQRFYDMALGLGSLAGHAGLPQVSLPLGTLHGLPLGLSLIGAPGSDEHLLALANQLT